MMETWVLPVGARSWSGRLLSPRRGAVPDCDGVQSVQQGCWRGRSSKLRKRSGNCEGRIALLAGATGLPSVTPVSWW